jgi:hypothetical protein
MEQSTPHSMILQNLSSGTMYQITDAHLLDYASDSPILWEELP